jgi:hypothetical protein
MNLRSIGGTTDSIIEDKKKGKEKAAVAEIETLKRTIY